MGNRLYDGEWGAGSTVVCAGSSRDSSAESADAIHADLMTSLSEILGYETELGWKIVMQQEDPCLHNAHQHLRNDSFMAIEVESEA